MTAVLSTLSFGVDRFSRNGFRLCFGSPATTPAPARRSR